jgi:hypothetical protein
MGTAEDTTIFLDSMSDDPAAAVVARRRQHGDRALKAVKDVPLAGGQYLEGLVVLVSAVFALTHKTAL